jgi:hypothetical protein
LIEIIESKKVLSRSRIREAVPDYSGIQGFFKPGFYIKDLESWQKTLQGRGVKIKFPLMKNEKFKMNFFIVEDPEGNLLQFYNFFQ